MYSYQRNKRNRSKYSFQTYPSSTSYDFISLPFYHVFKTHFVSVRVVIHRTTNSALENAVLSGSIPWHFWISTVHWINTVQDPHTMFLAYCQGTTHVLSFPGHVWELTHVGLCSQAKLLSVPPCMQAHVAASWCLDIIFQLLIIYPAPTLRKALCWKASQPNSTSIRCFHAYGSMSYHVLLLSDKKSLQYSTMLCPHLPLPLSVNSGWT